MSSFDNFQPPPIIIYRSGDVVKFNGMEYRVENVVVRGHDLYLQLIGPFLRDKSFQAKASEVIKIGR